jgi:hypothetical protein
MKALLLIPFLLFLTPLCLADILTYLTPSPFSPFKVGGEEVEGEEEKEGRRRGETYLIL